MGVSLGSTRLNPIPTPRQPSSPRRIPNPLAALGIHVKINSWPECATENHPGTGPDMNGEQVMNIAKTEFWSDFVEAPGLVMRNLSDATIERKMRQALESADEDADIFACRTIHTYEARAEKRFCFVKIRGVISADHPVED